MPLKATQEYLQGMRTTIRYNAPAYGYSVTITASFAALVATSGNPSVPEIFLFAVGAALAFTLVEALGSNFFRDRMRGERPEVVVLGSALSVASITSALGAATLLGWLLGSWVPWLFGPFTATVIYLTVFGLEIALAHRVSE